MKKSDLVFTDGEYDFVRACVFNRVDFDADYAKKLNAIIRKAENVDEFIQLYLGEKSFVRQQAYAEMSKRFDATGHWYRIRELLGDRCVKTLSDAGGLKVGNVGFSVIIGNGDGDGYTRSAVLERNEWNEDFLKFETSIEGDDITVYNYDCGYDAAYKLSGRFGVYAGQGFVVFEKWD